MLLNDIGKVPTTTLKKINQHLQSNYGFTINESAKDRDLELIMEQIQEEITELKIKGDDAKKSPEISKRLLVLEGIRNLREFALMQFQSPMLDHVVNGMTDYVVDAFHICGTCMDDFEDAIRDAMKEYRSSRYRFPDDLIEQKVRSAAMAKLQANSANQLPAMMEEMTEEDEEMKGSDLGESRIDELSSDTLKSYADKADPWQRDKGTASADARLRARAGQPKSSGSMPGYEKTEESGDQWASVGKRASATGGHAHTDLSKGQKNVLGKLGFSMPEEPPEEQPRMIRGKDGRMVPDPFDVQRIARKKGMSMGESQNLVRKLRTLLETEVSQAEVMMAAKGFAQELQEMIEKIGRLQNEDLPPVTDQMRETYGMESASAFQTQIAGALQSVMDSLYTAKSQVDDAVSNMAETGQVGAAVDMDKDIMGGDLGTDLGPDAAMDAELDLDNIGDELGADDEFGGADEEEPLGRAMKKESVETLQRKVLEMQRIVERARQLKEASKK